MQVIRSLIFTLCIGLSFGDQCPVFSWGVKSVANPSMILTRSDEFAELMTPMLAERPFVVFLENNLANKDFLCTSGADGKSCFARLQGVSDKTFHAAVENPVESLRSIPSEQEEIFVDEFGKLSKPLEVAAGKITFIKFNNDKSAPRELSLESHDSIIAAISSQLGENVFYVYTCEPLTSPLKRQRRETPDTGYFVFREPSKLLLYFTSLSINQSLSVTHLDIKNMNVKSENATTMSVTLSPTNGPSLTFDVTYAGGYFFMKNVMYNNVSFLSSEVYAPTDFSYFCGNLILRNIATEKIHLQWNSLQFQAPFNSTDNPNFMFGDAWHCVGFFTGGILSGLLIVALLLTITFIGVCWMMDINTMDRFDDPKGKTITINSSD